jgi:hypothetical protein
LRKKPKGGVLQISVFLLVLALGCVPQPPENDVASIKKLLLELEKGLREKDVEILGSVTSKQQGDLAAALIADFSPWGEIKNIYIAGKRFTIVGDSAKVELELKMKALEGEDQSEKSGKPVNLFLNKTKGKWRIETYEIITDDVSGGKSEDI